MVSATFSQRKGLLGLLLFFLALNITIGMAFSILAPYILSSTGNDSATLGSVQSAAAIGAVVGGLLVSLWGGFKRRMKSISHRRSADRALRPAHSALGRSLPAWMLAAALGGIFPPFTNGASQAIWQAKVAPDVQGRVFSARRMIAWLSGPITPVLAGALADYVTEPAMRSQSWLAKMFGPIIGHRAGLGHGGAVHPGGRGLRADHPVRHLLRARGAQPGGRPARSRPAGKGARLTGILTISSGSNPQKRLL